MIALALATATADPADFDALAAAVEKCDRAAVATTVTDAVQRHSRFLIDAYTEQRAIAAARADWAERRRKLHAGERTTDTEAILTLAREAIEDRQRALDDKTVLDRQEQDMVTYFRTQYLTRCAGRGEK